MDTILTYMKEHLALVIVLAIILVMVVVLLVLLGTEISRAKKRDKAAETDAAKETPEETPQAVPAEEAPVAETVPAESAAPPEEMPQAVPAETASAETAEPPQDEAPALPEGAVEEKTEKGPSFVFVPVVKEEQRHQPATSKKKPAVAVAAAKKDKEEETMKQENKPAPKKAAPAPAPAPAKKATKSVGKWVIDNVKGKYWLSLIAPNGQVMLESPTAYASLSSARSGIKTYQDNIAAERLEITEHKNGDSQVQVLNARGGLLATSSTYSSRSQAENALASIKRWAATTVIVENADEDDKK